MNNSPKALRQQTARMTNSDHRLMSEMESDRLALLQHLQKLIKINPKEARRAMEMSQEHAPELFLIAQGQPLSQWAESLMNSDSMHSLLSRNPSQAKTLLEQPDLQSLLEQLP